MMVAIASLGVVSSALITTHIMMSTTSSGTSGYPGTRKGRGAAGCERRSTMSARVTGIQNSAYDITAILVSSSKVPETASTAAHAQVSNNEVTGTRVLGLKRPKRAKKSPSRAEAKETRARVRIVPLREPMHEITKISAATATARVPRKVCTARAATDGASG